MAASTVSEKMTCLGASSDSEEPVSNNGPCSSQGLKSHHCILNLSEIGRSTSHDMLSRILPFNASWVIFITEVFRA